MLLLSTYAENVNFCNLTGLQRGETSFIVAGACHMHSLRGEGSSMLLRLLRPLGHLTRHLTLASCSGVVVAHAARRCCWQMMLSMSS